MFSGASSVQLCIGELRVSVVSRQPLILDHLRQRYRHFTVAGGTPDFEIEMRHLQDPADAARFLNVPVDLITELIREPAPGAAAKTSEKHAGLFSTDDAAASRKTKLDSKPEVRRIGGRVVFRRIDFAGSLDLTAGHGRVVFAERMQTIAVESFLRVAYSFLAAEQGGLLLHSAAVARGAHGYIFPGPSETGKSTIASLVTRQEQVLSDEMVLVRKIKGAYRVWSSPFFGTNESTELNVGAPLRAAFLPVKDTRVYVEKTSPGRALAKLLASVLFFDQDLAANERLLSIATDLVGTVPFFDMHFRRDGAFWICIEELEQKGFTPC